MVFLERTARKLDVWFMNTKVKPIHVVILERMHASLWRERHAAQTAANIRVFSSEKLISNCADVAGGFVRSV